MPRGKDMDASSPGMIGEGEEADRVWHHAKRDAMCFLAETQGFVLCCLDDDGDVVYFGCGACSPRQMLGILAFVHLKSNEDGVTLHAQVEEEERKNAATN